MADEAMVRLVDLTRRFGETIALDRVSFSVPAASLFALLGPNGCGKTTLFRIVSTLLAPTSGTVWVAGADVTHERNRVLQEMGVVFQHPSLDKKLTALENLLHQGLLYGLSGAPLRRRSLELLDRFGVADRTNDLTETLSGGLQRRVELAKGLLHGPKLLILDEPSTGLDPAARAALLKYLTELRDNDGVTCLLTTHLMDEAERCDLVAILDEGRLVALDSPLHLKKAIGGEILTLTTSNAPNLAAAISGRFGLRAQAMADSVRIERERAHELIPQLIEAFPGDIDAVVLGKPTLDDVFFRLTGRAFNGRRR